MAINLPQEVKKKIGDYQKEKKELLDSALCLPGKRVAKWVNPENLHLTLIFLGNIKKEKIEKLFASIEQEVEKTKPFQINLEKAVYAPPGKTPPRMIWLKVKKSDSLKQLKKGIDKSLSQNSSFFFSSEPREFSPHITLSRINTLAWSQIEPEERPNIEEDFNLEILVDSLKLMESKLKKEGAEYSILKNFTFNRGG